ncbi:YdeI/OmpD-associated family protein [Pseudoflavonifractor sp. 60]|uniref:YdeI/OmpD-associated family protein n=1 Tax=Pseudoflavonifractor sp. 60 TaxID=2304576 RepID=UPI00136C285F|nr:YdeI/OmpD-associated family protein [Pseudoflavonifractor sp. 60]
MSYPDLNALLQGDPDAQHYFETLPDYAREQIRTRPSHINSFSSLKNYAQNILRGDN